MGQLSNLKKYSNFKCSLPCLDSVMSIKSLVMIETFSRKLFKCWDNILKVSTYHITLMNAEVCNLVLGIELCTCHGRNQTCNLVWES